MSDLVAELETRLSAARCTAGKSGPRQGAAAKVLAVLEAFSAQGGVTTLAQLTKRSGLPRSTAYRMLTYLRDAGFADFENGHFRLSGKVSLLSAGRPTEVTPQARTILMPFLVELYELTHELVQLVVPAGNSGHVVERVHSYRSTSLAVERGEVQPLHRTAAGKVLIAHRERDGEGHSPDQTDLWQVEEPRRTAFAHELSSARVSGVAYERGDWRSDVVGVAVAVRGAKQEVLASITVVGPAGQFRPEAVAPHLRRIGQFATRELQGVRRPGRQDSIAS